MAGYRPTANRTALLLATSVLIADPYAYASLSGVHESPGIRSLQERIVPELMAFQLFNSVSDVPTAAEFIHSRRSIYYHDRRRYPFYFQGTPREGGLFTPSIVKTDSTTAYLAETLAQVVGERRDSGEAMDVVLARLARRDREAITFAFFRRAAMRASMTTPMQIRASISIAYSRHHMHLAPGAIVLPGVPGLKAFDGDLLGSRMPVPEFSWFMAVYRWASPEFVRRVAGGDPQTWAQLTSFALSDEGKEFRLRLYAYKRAQVASGATARSEDRRRLASVQARVPPQQLWRDGLSRVGLAFWPRLERRDAVSVTVMIHCVNDNEYKGINQACRDAGMAAGGIVSGNFTAGEILGEISGLSFLLVRSRAGSSGPNSSQGVISDAIDDFAPRCVVAVGVGFGLRPEATNGSVMIATEVKDYERVRLGTGKNSQLELRERGTTQNPDPIRLGKLIALASSLGIKAAPGQMLSGEKLVDWKRFTGQLRKRFPDAVGGEMEGTGIASACARRGVPWLLMKAVSDSADGSKKTVHQDEDAAQTEASKRAMELLIASARSELL